MSLLMSKKHRIQSALIKIRNNTDPNTSNDFLNYFCLPQIITTHEEEKPLPKYCRPAPGSKKKPSLQIANKFVHCLLKVC